MLNFLKQAGITLGYVNGFLRMMKSMGWNWGMFKDDVKNGWKTRLLEILANPSALFINRRGWAMKQRLKRRTKYMKFKK